MGPDPRRYNINPWRCIMGSVAMHTEPQKKNRSQGRRASKGSSKKRLGEIGAVGADHGQKRRNHQKRKSHKSVFVINVCVVCTVCVLFFRSYFNNLLAFYSVILCVCVHIRMGCLHFL
eukprot:279598_1